MSIKQLNAQWKAKGLAAIAKMNLAATYLEDGAFVSGAECLREAADLLVDAHEIRVKALNQASAKYRPRAKK